MKIKRTINVPQMVVVRSRGLNPVDAVLDYIQNRFPGVKHKVMNMQPDDLNRTFNVDFNYEKKIRKGRQYGPGPAIFKITARHKAPSENVKIKIVGFSQ